MSRIGQIASEYEDTFGYWPSWTDEAFQVYAEDYMHHAGAGGRGAPSPGTDAGEENKDGGTHVDGAAPAQSTGAGDPPSGVSQPRLPAPIFQAISDHCNRMADAARDAGDFARAREWRAMAAGRL